MTNNGAGKTRNLGNVIYDSSADAPSGRKRVGISATEIELLDDIPPTARTGATASNNTQAAKRGRVFETQTLSSGVDKQKQQNNYQTLSHNRDQPKANIIYRDGNDPQMKSALDKLIDKYAPDAVPQNLINSGTTIRQPLSQVNTGTSRDEQSFSTFPSSSTTSNDYSTVIRPKSGQMPSNPPQTRNNNNQSITQQRPTTNYDSFQTFTSPPRQQQQPPQLSVPVQTKNGNFTQVVPGKLYNLHDDPLHLLYDRQPPVPPHLQQSTRQPPPPLPQQQQQQPPPYKTTFQPSNNFQTVQDPRAVMFTNESQRYPQQPIPITSDTSFNGMQPFDLGILIKRVQQDYLREIQPFVSSVKFVEKDQEYGQSLADVDFITPVTVRKGFSRQADDILRRSAGRQDRHQTTANRPQARDPYSDDDDDDDDYIEDLRPSKRRQRLEKLDSKQSFTSVTSVTTTGSGYDSQPSSLYQRDSGNTYDRSLSPPPPPLPPPKGDQTKIPPQTKASPAPKNPSATLPPSKPITHSESDEEEVSPAAPAPPPPPAATKPATRITSDRRSVTSSDGSLTDDQGDNFAKYNEHDNPQNPPSKPSATINAVVTTSPVLSNTNKTARERSNAGNQVQRSEDIHPAPPIIPSSQPGSNPPTNTRTPRKKSETEDSASVVSGSVNYSDSGDDSYNHQTTPANAPQTSSNNPSSAARTTGPNSNTPAANARTTGDNNSRQAAKPGTNPNINSAPLDQRNPTTGSAAPTTNQPASMGGGATAAQTGSTRLFKKDNDNKSGARQTNKEAPTSFGNKIKKLFHRK